MLATFYQSRFSPRSLFAAGEQGGWYDPSDISTMFQDSAGTTPVTAVGQPVGLMLDKHAGLALGSELLESGAPDGTGWSFSTIDASAKTATTVTFGTQFANRGNSTPTVAGGVYKFTFQARTITGNTALAVFTEGSAGGDFRSVTLDGTLRTYTAYALGSATSGTVNFGIQDRNASGFGQIEFHDASVKLVSGNHLIQATAASRPILRQDASNFYYLEFDGVDDGLASAATVNFTASQQLTFFAGITKTAASGLGALCELSALPTAAGSFSIQAPASFEDLGFYAVGSTTSVNRIATPFAAPSSKVLSCLFNTAGGAGANVSPRVNATVPTLTADANLGAAVFQNATVYVGRRGGSTFPFIGRLYQLVLRGATSDATTIANTERFVGSKMGIAL